VRGCSALRPISRELSRCLGRLAVRSRVSSMFSPSGLWSGILQQSLASRHRRVGNEPSASVSFLPFVSLTGSPRETRVIVLVDRVSG
jgi:hypothetical protein